ncbi:proteinaceous RNase P 1, chloroplastic/mitochondrial-like [Quillaja saponaria]|uniref:Proteinaceous RNase P 1, chloroplastic/mitochondrial-like n=1 Tax=Quillaja saponaria TaxID=32244 RepID=A0AAD7VFC7_QUISA|nr:proteinaceous RNase P 1, chloroplastic/mitochondrial-like [Quillaja saponaria]
MLLGSSFVPSPGAIPLFSFCTRYPFLRVCWDSCRAFSPVVRCHTSFIIKPVLNRISVSGFSLNRTAYMSTSAFPASLSIHESSTSSASKVSNKSKKKARQESPEALLRHKLNMDVRDAHVLNLGLKRGFEIFQQMINEKVSPNEATFTSAARLAIAKEDPEMAFELVKQMKRFDIPPKLRSYGPALFGFCKKGEADKAYDVDTPHGFIRGCCRGA